MKKLVLLGLVAWLSVVAVQPAQAQSDGKWATLKGQFLFGKEGTKIPERSKLTANKDLEVCGKETLFEESLVVNKENRGIQHVYLWLDKKPSKIHPDVEAKSKEDVEITLDNVLCRFEPHAVAVAVGQKFSIKNSDPVGHNSLIQFLKNTSINPIIPAGGQVEVKLTKAETLPMQVSCSIHNWMRGVVLVQDHPYFALTDADGKFELANLPAGEKIVLKVWHEAFKNVQEVEIDGKGAKWNRGRYEINLTPGKDEEHQYILDPAKIKS